MFFEGADLTSDEEYDPPIDGMRRRLVEQYYSRIDFRSRSDVGKLLFAYTEIVLRIERDSPSEAKDLLRRMKADGYDFDGETFVSLPSNQQPLVETIRALATSLNLKGLEIEISRLARATDEKIRH